MLSYCSSSWFFQVYIIENMDDVGRSIKSKYECLLFDMDDTLYPLSSGLNLACRKNIEEFMVRTLQIEESEVPRMCLELYRENGTTMAGQKAFGCEFDNDEFHAYVHGRLPYDVLKPDLVLMNLLLSMPQPKIIFTNADKAHAAQVLHRLGLKECFEGIICFETLKHIESLDPIATPDENVLAEGAPQANATDLTDGNSHNSNSKSYVNPLWKPLKLLFRLQTLTITKQ